MSLDDEMQVYHDLRRRSSRVLRTRFRSAAVPMPPSMTSGHRRDQQISGVHFISRSIKLVVTLRRPCLNLKVCLRHTSGGFTTENSEVTERLSPLLSSFLFSVPQGRKNLKFFPDNVTCLAHRVISTLVISFFSVLSVSRWCVFFLAPAEGRAVISAL